MPLPTTSTTAEVRLALGVRTFVVASGLGLTVGQRLRAAVIGKEATHYLEGAVKAYGTGPVLEITADAKKGSGTFFNWTIDEVPISSAIPLGSPYLRSGGTTWSGKRDEEGHREYTIKYLVLCNSLDGPANVLNTPGLPRPGSRWLIDNDKDVWAFALWNATVTPVMKRGPNTAFEVEIPFSTKLPGKACKDRQFENPLLEPPKISGGFNKYREEATKDRFGNPIVNSAHEQIRGPLNEWEAGRPTVSIEINVAKLDLTLLLSMAGTVNDTPLWGFAERCVFLQHPSWERKFYGQCFPYYTLKLEFEINPDTWDRNILDEGTKALRGRWVNDAWKLSPIPGYVGDENPDPTNPSHFVKFKDRDNNFTRVILDGAGKPYNPTPIAITRACELCPDGLPETWNIADPQSVIGQEIIDVDVVEAPAVGACTWRKEVGAKRYTLTAVLVGADNIQWQLDYESTAAGGAAAGGPVMVGSWSETFAGDEGKCSPWPKSLRKTFGNLTIPSVVNMSTTLNTPGYIPVSKFHESHFPLITGLPLRLT